MRHTRLLFVLLLAAACTDARTSALAGLRGVKLSPARAKPDFTLTDTQGRPFAFRAATKGTVTLLYFGYTNCADVCPEHLSNISHALAQLPAADRSRVSVVFVTTDPARDTPEHLRAWLNNFSPSFVGLRGDPRDVNQIEASLGLPASVTEPMPNMPGPRVQSYGVGHAAQVLAFSPDDTLRTEYPSGFTTKDWVNDLPKLLTLSR